jgi:hypothetical protein
MHHALLSLDMESISPEAKFFCVRFVAMSGGDQPVKLTVKELAAALGVTDRVVTSSLLELVDNGFLSLKKIVEGKGRPKSEYQCLPAFTKKLKALSATLPMIHSSKIDHVLASAAKDVAGMSNTNRLLLAVLLAHADAFGVVRDLGLADLCKLTGLNRVRVKGHIHKLQSISIFRFWKDGLTDPKLFGAVKTVYFLDLSHSALGPAHNSTAVFVFSGVHYIEYRDLDEAALIGKAAYSPRYQPLTFDWALPCAGFMPIDGKYNLLAAYFSSLWSPVGRVAQIELLQLKLDEYASFLLTNHWCCLMPAPSPSDPVLLEIIANDLKVLRRSKLDADLDLLSEFLYEVARLQAIRYQDLFDKLQLVSYSSMEFMILPSTEKGSYCGRRVLLVAPKQSVKNPGCYVVTRDVLSGVQKKEFKSEGDIPRSDRVTYGLLKSRKCPKRYGAFSLKKA